MPTNPIAPITRISQQLENIAEIFGIERQPAINNPDNSPPANIEEKPAIIHTDPSNRLKRRQYRGVEMFILTGDYADQQVYLGTDIVKVSMNQTANWQDKDGQRMRVGVNFLNVSARSINFTVDLYDPNGDISPVVENIAHIQEITESAGNTPPLLLIKIGDTVYQNAVSTTFEPEFSEPLPTTNNGLNQRSGGYRRAIVQLAFKVPGGQGSAYRSAQPFNTDTEMKSVFDSLTQAEIQKQGTQAVGELQLSQCLTEAENEEFQAALDGERLADPSTYLTMPSELFLQLSTAGLPDNILSDAGFQERLRKEMSVRIASLQPTGTHTTEQLASSLYTGVPLAGYQGDFSALLVNYDAIINGIINNAIDELPPGADSILNGASRCGRSIRDSGGLKLVAQTSTTDPNFTVANINNLIANNDLSDTQIKDLFGMSNKVSLEVVQDLRDHKFFASREEFIALLGEATDGYTAQVAWASLEQNELDNLNEINTFLVDSDRDSIKSRFGISSNNIADALINKNFSSKQDFIQTIYSIDQPGETYTAKDAFDNTGKYWVNFQLNADNDSV